MCNYWPKAASVLNPPKKLWYARKCSELKHNCYIWFEQGKFQYMYFNIWICLTQNSVCVVLINTLVSLFTEIDVDLKIAATVIRIMRVLHVTFTKILQNAPSYVAVAVSFSASSATNKKQDTQNTMLDRSLVQSNCETYRNVCTFTWTSMATPALRLLGSTRVSDYDLYGRTWACLICSLYMCYHQFQWLRLFIRTLSTGPCQCSYTFVSYLALCSLCRWSESQNIIRRDS